MENLSTYEFLEAVQREAKRRLEEDPSVIASNVLGSHSNLETPEAKLLALLVLLR